MNASTSARIAAWSLKMARSESKASDADDEDLILKYGSPICLDEKGQLERLNQAYFAGKFAKDTLTVFVPGEDRFYVYDVNSGLWVHQTERWVGAQVHQLMLNFVRDKGIGGVEFSLTRHLLDSIIVQMQGILEDREAFQTPCKLIHVKNGMLDLESGKPVLMHFGPEYGSRRQIQIDFDPHAECERFKDQLLAPAVELDDISLLFAEKCGDWAVDW